MKSLGNIDLQSNLLLNPVLEQVENYPADPKVGHFIFKGQRVLICIEIQDGLPVWAPLTVPLNTHIHDQPVASTNWTITHELNSSSVFAQVITSDGKHIIPEEVTCNYNQTVITFYAAQAGRAVLMIGSDEGVPRRTIAYEQDFVVDSDTWVVTHSLGYEPLIRVFVGSEEVQPTSIIHDDANQSTVSFSTAQAGHVRCL